MKVNLNKIPARVSPFEDKKVEISFREAVINYLWNKAGNTAAQAKFALALVDEKGETEITDEQKGWLKEVAEKAGFPIFAKEALLAAIGETTEQLEKSE